MIAKHDKVWVDGLGWAMVAKVLGGDTFICVYILHGEYEYTISKTSSITVRGHYPTMLEILIPTPDVNPSEPDPSVVAPEFVKLESG
jgi:hypothetical protein